MGKLLSEVSETRSNVKKKEQSLPTKLVIRRLPSTLTEEELKAKLTFPPYDYFFFTGPNYSFGNDGFTRAYVNFIEYNDVLEFRNKFDGYIFYDNLGNEFSAVIEYAPCQQIPRTKQKIDQKINTFDKDPEYLQFLENLGKQVELLPSAEKYIEELQALTIADKKREKIRTPLTDYLKEKRDSRIAARQLAIAQREKERKQRLEEKEKRREREKERKSKQEKEKLDRKNLEKEKSEKKEYKKDKVKDGDEKRVNDDAKLNDALKVENKEKAEQFKSTEHYKTTETNRSSKSYESKKRYTERNDKYREKDDRQSRSYRNDGQDKYNNDQYENRKNRHSRDKESNLEDVSKERNISKECEKVEKPKEVAETPDPTRVKKLQQEQVKVEENELNDKAPVVSTEESKKEASSSVKSAKKPRPEIKIYRPPSDRSAPAKSEKKDTDNVKGEKVKSIREKTRDNSRSTRYDKYDKSQGEIRKKAERSIENENRSSRDNKCDNSTSHDRTAEKILEKIKSDVNKSYDKISDREEKTLKKTNAEIERDKELEQERYRMNWLVKQ
ncbi:regulator of nonsense transcripts 3B isoform X2 [Hydra vulgaris]|uniref:Regulator of nonsense transcripts 3B isoform X2 n=1 Tax=Hydra vulgaris TaxID=6087 RepID=A0ABM4B8A2_HYDVU